MSSSSNQNPYALMPPRTLRIQQLRAHSLIPRLHHSIAIATGIHTELGAAKVGTVMTGNLADGINDKVDDEVR